VYFLQILKCEFVPGIFVKKELFFYVLLSNFLYADLFANGFGPQSIIISTIKHQIKEYKKSPNVLTIDYDYNIYQTNYKGKGTYIQASENEMFILSQGKVFIEKDTGLKHF
jgi:inner membrane protein